MTEQHAPAKPFQVEQADLDKLVAFLREAGRPMTLDELTRQYIALLRARVTAEAASAA
jgi:hypothetical protein